MKKRIFSALLVVCMLLTMLPVNVFAAGNGKLTITFKVVDEKGNPVSGIAMYLQTQNPYQTFDLAESEGPTDENGETTLTYDNPYTGTPYVLVCGPVNGEAFDYSWDYKGVAREVTVTDGNGVVKMVKQGEYPTTYAQNAEVIASGNASFTFVSYVKAIDGREFSVDFENAEGVEAQSAITGSVITLPTPRAREGWDFKGWKDKEGKTYTEKYVVSGNATLTAIWECAHEKESGYCTVEGCNHPSGPNDCCPKKEPVTYTVTYVYGNGQDDTTDTQTSTANSVEFNLPENPSWTCHKFDCWVSETNVSIYGSKVTVSKPEMTLTAKWKEAHTDSDKDGICDCGEKCFHVQEGETYCTVENCTHGEDGRNCCPKELIKYTVTYKDYYGEGEDLVDEQETAKNPAEFALPVNPSKDGYAFVEWTNAKGHSMGDYDSGRKITVDKENPDAVLYAKWKANTYTVDFNPNGGEGEMESMEFTYDEAQTLTANAFTRVGYEFIGWNTEDDGSGTSYFDKAEVKNLTAQNGATVTLYAQWKIKPEVTIDYEPPVQLDKDGKGDIDVTVKATYLPVNSEGKGYEFRVVLFVGETEVARSELMWATGDTLDHVINLKIDDEVFYNGKTISVQILDDDGDVHAEGESEKKLSFKHTYVVTFVNDGEEYEVQYVKEDEGITDIPALSKTGYTFLGWFEDGADEAYNFSTPVTDDVTLYAVWTPYQYKMIYNGNGGLDPWNSPVKDGYTWTYDTNVAIYSFESFALEGHSCIGWAFTPNATTPDIPYGTYNIDVTFEKLPYLETVKNGAEVVLYAIWEANDYKATYDIYGRWNTSKESCGDINTTLDVTFDTEIPDLADAIAKYEKNYEFSGWYIDNDNSGKISDGDTKLEAGMKMPAGDITLVGTFLRIVSEDTAKIAAIPDQIYNGSAQEPELTVKVGSATLVKDVDYTVEYSGNVNVGTATATITCKGDFTGTVSTTFQIAPKPLTITATAKDKTYDGNDAADVELTIEGVVEGETITAENVVAKFKDKNAGEDKEVTVTFDLVAGEGTVLTNYSYVTEVKTTATIDKAPLTVTVENKTKVYGDADPDFTFTAATLADGDTADEIDVEFTREVGEDVDTYAINATAENPNYVITVVPGTLTITERNLNDTAIEIADLEDVTYNGKEQKAEVEATATLAINENDPVDLVEGTDYTVTYNPAAPVDAGEVTVTIEGKGNYTGTVTKTYEIKQKELTFTVTAKEKVYDGNTDVELTVEVKGAVEGEVIKVAATGHFETKDAGDKKVFIDTFNPTAEAPAKLTNYTWTVPTETTGKITKRAITVTALNQETMHGVPFNFSSPVLGKHYKVTNMVPGEESLLKVKLGTKAVWDKSGNYEIYFISADAGINYEITTVKGNIYVFGKAMSSVNGATKKCKEPFIDVEENDWFHDDVEYVYVNGIMNGVSSNEFAPYAIVNRAMVVTTLWRMEGCPEVRNAPTFTDVPDGLWYSEAVAWAAANGIVKGMGDGTFAPLDSITREQVAAMLNRYADYNGWTIEAEDTDAYIHSAWSEENVDWADTVGLFDLDINIVNLTKAANRAELAAYLTRFLQNVAE